MPPRLVGESSTGSLTSEAPYSCSAGNQSLSCLLVQHRKLKTAASRKSWIRSSSQHAARYSAGSRSNGSASWQKNLTPLRSTDMLRTPPLPSPRIAKCAASWRRAWKARSRPPTHPVPVNPHRPGTMHHSRHCGSGSSASSSSHQCRRATRKWSPCFGR